MNNQNQFYHLTGVSKAGFLPCPALHPHTPPHPHTHTPALRAARLLPVLALVGMMAGCSNDPYPQKDNDENAFYSALGEDPKTLDSSVAYTVSDQEVLMNIMDTYLEYDYLKRNPVVLVPSMGAKMPDRKPYVFTEQVPQKDKDGNPVTDKQGKPVTKPTVQHGEIWTFTIKPGIRFADDPCFTKTGSKGREATAADFVYAFKRMADPAVNCPILQYILPHVIGMQEFYDEAAAKAGAAKKAHKKFVIDLNKPVSGVQVDPHDPYTFRITLRDQYPQLKYLMAMSFTAPIAHEAVDYYDGGPHGQLRQHPVGTGPYKLAEWTEKERLVLVKNDNYHTDTYPTVGMPGDREKGLLADAGKPLPFINKVVYTIIKDPIPGWNLFLQGYMDSWGVPKEAFNQVITHSGNLSADMKSRGITLSTSPGLDVMYFGFNMQDSLVGGYSPKKRKLRQALSMAFDVDEFLDLTRNGRGIPAQGVLPPGIFGYDPNYRNPYRQFNLEKAKQLLAEAGYSNGIDPTTGKPLEIYYDDTSSSPEETQANGLFIRQMEQLGIKIIERPWLYTVFQDRVNNMQYEMMTFGWVADYPDPENFYLLFYSPNKAPGPNAVDYERPGFDALYKQMASMDDTPQRQQIINQMRAMLQEDCPWIFGYHSLSYGLRYDWVKNSKAHPIAENTLKYIRIDYQLRARRRAEWNRPRYDFLAAVLGFLVVLSVPAVVARRKQHTLSARAARQTLIFRSPEEGGTR